ncbi:MAG: ABC transporter ATP-binding protein [Bacteroidales bacterium]
MSEPVVNCLNIRRSYDGEIALSNISFEAGRGEIFGLIGPDGAGKTTLFRILSTLILPDSGSARVLGLDVIRDYAAIRKSIGYMPGRFSLYQDLTVEENLRFYASVFGVQIAVNYDLIREIYSSLEPFRNRRAGKLSGGMKQKLALACALVHRPGLLILDEPTTGVDAVSRKEFWDHLAKLKSEGMTILVSTPYMDEAQRCDRLALIQKGEFLDVGSPAQIRRGFVGELYSLQCSDRYKALRLLREYDSIGSVHAFGQSLHFTLKTGGTPSGLEQNLVGNHIGDIRITLVEPGVEDCFMQKMSNDRVK